MMTNSLNDLFPSHPDHPFYNYTHCGIEIRPGIEEACEQRAQEALGSAIYKIENASNPRFMERVKQIQTAAFIEFSSNHDYWDTSNKIVGNIRDRVNFYDTCQRINKIYQMMGQSLERGPFLFQEIVLDNIFKGLFNGVIDHQDKPSMLRYRSHPSHQFSVISRSENKELPIFDNFRSYIRENKEKDPRFKYLLTLEERIASEKDPQKLRSLSVLRRKALSEFYTVFPLADEVPSLLANLKNAVERMIESEDDPVDIAAYVHMKLVEIHPGVDANGRTSRIALNVFLRLAGKELVYFPSQKEYMTAVRDSSKANDYKIFASLVRSRLSSGTSKE